MRITDSAIAQLFYYVEGMKKENHPVIGAILITPFEWTIYDLVTKKHISFTIRNFDEEIIYKYLTKGFEAIPDFSKILPLPLKDLLEIIDIDNEIEKNYEKLITIGDKQANLPEDVKNIKFEHLIAEYITRSKKKKISLKLGQNILNILSLGAAYSEEEIDKIKLDIPNQCEKLKCRVRFWEYLSQLSDWPSGKKCDHCKISYYMFRPDFPDQGVHDGNIKFYYNRKHNKSF